MAEGAQSLHYAVRWRVIARYLGQLCLTLTVLAAVPLLVAVVNGDVPMIGRCGGALAAFLLLGLMARIRCDNRIQTNEALVLIALAFLVASVVMTVVLGGGGTAVEDALFESISAITTTGLSTSGTVEDRSATVLFTRAWMQWFGGLGIVALSLAFLVDPGQVAKRLGVGLGESGGLVGGTRAYARRVVVVYLVLSLGAVVAIWAASGELGQAVLYALSAVSTGGFAPDDRSLGGLDGCLAPWAVTAFSVLGGVSFFLYVRVSVGKRGSRELGREALCYLVAGTLATALLFLTMTRVAGMEEAAAVRHAPLMALSAQSTTGFSSLDAAELDGSSKLILIGSMAIGGGAGSTAGGVKILRVLILVQVVALLMRRLGMPRHAVTHERLSGKRIGDAEVRRALALVILFGVTVVVSWFPFVAAGHDPLDALFEVTSATGTVGLSTGIANQELASGLKAVLCIDMLLGRLEIVAWLVLIAPRTWIGRRNMNEKKARR